jgi:arginyl-tRNA synthetase
MKTLQLILQEKATNAIKKAFANQLNEVDLTAEVTQTQASTHGHYQCNNALKLSKILKKNPREIANLIIENFEKDDIIEKIEIAGPGFINLFISNKFLSQDLQKVYGDPHYGISMPGEKKKIIVEYSSPNIAKELHVGHIRSTIIGECLARLFEFLGYDVLRLNHIGDWGTQFGMLIAYMKKFEPEVLEGKKEADLTALTNWYKASKKLFDEDAQFKKTAQLEVVNLQSGKEDAIKPWEIICDISKKAFYEIYDLLDVKIQERGESFYNPYLKGIVKDLEKKGLIEISDGAKCIFIEGYKNREGNTLPVMVQKSDGGFNYDTTDIAAFQHRVVDEKADRIIVVTDSGQSLHFKMVYEAVVRAGYLDPKKVRFDHVTFGLVLGKDGKKFKTRSGKTEKLIDLLNEAILRAKDIIKEKNPNLLNEELDNLAKVIGIDAIKYADLSSYRLKDYVFSYDKMLQFEGNTAPFLLYSYVRIKGIKRKYQGSDLEKVLETSKIEITHPSEFDLGLHLRRFSETLNSVKKDLLPNRLCDYLFELAEKFNAFFRDCQVIGSKEEKSRLLLCDLTEKILKQGLHILGLHTVERM